MASHNIAVKLCGVLQAQGDKEVTAREWRLLGQEQDGSQLLTWISDKDDKEVLNIGVYINRTKTLETLHTFSEKLNIIQASVNPTRTLIAYVVKIIFEDTEGKDPLYCPYVICLLPDHIRKPEVVAAGSTKQTMVQYIYGKSIKYNHGIRNDKFLMFKHLESINMYRTPLFLNELKDGSERWGYDGIYSDAESVLDVFSWAQWDCVNQVLFYIFYRAAFTSFAVGENVKSPCEMTPTLAAFQFHADLPYESVLNIPLNLPHMPSSGEGAVACGAYEDDPIPLRVHDCSLDLQIVCDQKGILCICHHYLYKPLDDSTTSLMMDESVDQDSAVNFAYSITLLQHGCVVHTVVPDLPWPLAKSLRPSYMLYADTQLLVKIPKLYTHLVDISLSHEFCCSIVLPMEEDEGGPRLAPIIGWGTHAMVDLKTLDVVTMTVADKDLAATFKSNTVIENKLAILHYLIQHEGNMDLAEELISWVCVRQHAAAALGEFQQLLREYLVASTHAHTRRALPASALPLMAMLPFTEFLTVATMKVVKVQVRETCVSVSQDLLWNSACVVLAPRQRVCQFAEDLWTRLWSKLNCEPAVRLRPDLVLARLRVSLHCYQPEALSRCSTPLSPMASGPPLGIPQRRSSIGTAQDSLPFFELDVCTASRQEHIIAANVREVCVHLMRGPSADGGGGRAGGAGAGEGARGVESDVHAVGARWGAAQLDAARSLCRALARSLNATVHHNQQRGFSFIDEMDPSHAFILFKVLEQFYLAAESMAYPMPQGFNSFFTYLGYRALPFEHFVQYVHRNVFELQIDVTKAIIACPGPGTEEDSKTTVNNKLRLIQLIGEGRARRALAAWGHRSAVVLRARDHAATLLSGAGAATHRDRARTHVHNDSGIAALPSGERLSPLDTFLDLLTAKASLNELDFNLIIEATIASLQQASTD